MLDFLPPIVGTGNPRVTVAPAVNNQVMEGYRNLWLAEAAVYSLETIDDLGGPPAIQTNYWPAVGWRLSFWERQTAQEVFLLPGRNVKSPGWDWMRAYSYYYDWCHYRIAYARGAAGAWIANQAAYPAYFCVGSYLRNAGFIRFTLQARVNSTQYWLVHVRCVVTDPHTQKFTPDMEGHYDQVPFVIG
jgi:hypothetical protein